jgi:hypothetical protein
MEWKASGAMVFLAAGLILIHLLASSASAYLLHTPYQQPSAFVVPGQSSYDTYEHGPVPTYLAWMSYSAPSRIEQYKPSAAAANDGSSVLPVQPGSSNSIPVSLAAGGTECLKILLLTIT